MRGHLYIEVGIRRWCLGCDQFQIFMGHARGWETHTGTTGDCPHNTNWAYAQKAVDEEKTAEDERLGRP